ncbi:hypothetical protein PANO66_00230 [Planktothrix agardhii]|uniref:Uncharacterized protein n=1 Tax=Planktothrix agardhii TaxID=1160 RepID=A0AAD1V457_PLAAG|nr:hypothetical protein PANO66_00230 [Planktothrix agardhii]
MKRPEVLPQIPPPLAPRARGFGGAVPVFPFDQGF